MYKRFKIIAELKLIRMARLCTGRTGFDLQKGNGFLSLPPSTGWLWGPHIQWVSGTLSPGVNVKVKNVWIFLSVYYYSLVLN